MPHDMHAIVSYLAQDRLDLAEKAKQLAQMTRELDFAPPKQRRSAACDFFLAQDRFDLAEKATHRCGDCRSKQGHAAGQCDADEHVVCGCNVVDFYDSAELKRGRAPQSRRAVHYLVVRAAPLNAGGNCSCMRFCVFGFEFNTTAKVKTHSCPEFLESKVSVLSRRFENKFHPGQPRAGTSWPGACLCLLASLCVR